MSDEVLLARAFLNRIVEPASVELWIAVRDHGPVAVAGDIRTGRAGESLLQSVAARLPQADPAADLDAALRRGIRLVVPESEEWPHFAMSALEAAGQRRAKRWLAGDRSRSTSGELVPPLALWVRGAGELSTLGTRSVSIVGSRASTPYGERIAYDFGSGLARHGFVVVSGGAYGIDAAAHRGALREGQSVLVSAGGLHQPYPASSAAIFEQVAESGLLISESPPGAEPRRSRFLTRNRLIAALGTGTVVVEAARRSGARNTARHCQDLGRPLMVVPGPVTSTMSAGCHDLLRAEGDPAGRARLVTDVGEVLEVVGGFGDVAGPADDDVGGSGPGDLRRRLDVLDDTARQVFDALPARGWVQPDRLIMRAGVAAVAVLQSLPTLEAAGLVERTAQGYRLARPERVARHED